MNKRKLGNKFEMSKLTALALCLIIVLCAAFGLAFIPAADMSDGDVAHALSYDEYNYADPVIDSIKENLWYFAAEYLNVPQARMRVEEWKDNGILPDPSSPGFEPIVIAIIDTGADLSHEIFGQGTEFDVLYKKDGEVVSACFGNKKVEFDDRSKTSHGTHVTGIAATLIRALGLSQYVKIMPIRVAPPPPATNTGSLSSSDTFKAEYVVEALKFATANGADIINMSFTALDSTDNSFKTKTRAAINTAAEKAVLVAAAGNNSKSSDNTGGYPAGFANVLGVMAYEPSSGMPAFAGSYSNYGSLYDIVAPGGTKTDNTKRIMSSIRVASGSEIYGYKHGTSMASPMVAVAAGLVMARFKNEYVMNPSQIRAIITNQISYEVAYNKTEYVGLSMFALTDDFDPEEVFLERPQSIEISPAAETQINQLITGIQPVTFTAKVGPENISPKTLVDWYVNNKIVATKIMTEKFIFDPREHSADGAGEFRVHCALSKSAVLPTSSVLISVKYIEARPLEIEIEASKTGTRTGKEVVYSLEGSGLENTNPSTVVKWYVSETPFFTDESTFNFSTATPYYQGVGDFVFKPEKAGTYYIAAVYGDKVIRSMVEVPVESTVLSYIVPFSIGGAVLLLLVAAVVALALLEIQRKNKISQARVKARTAAMLSMQYSAQMTEDAENLTESLEGEDYSGNSDGNEGSNDVNEGSNDIENNGDNSAGNNGDNGDNASLGAENGVGNADGTEAGDIQ